MTTKSKRFFCHNFQSFISLFTSLCSLSPVSVWTRFLKVLANSRQDYKMTFYWDPICLKRNVTCIPLTPMQWIRNAEMTQICQVCLCRCSEWGQENQSKLYIYNHWLVVGTHGQKFRSSQRRTRGFTRQYGRQTPFSSPEPPFLLVTWSAKRRALVAAITGCP